MFRVLAGRLRQGVSALRPRLPTDRDTAIAALPVDAQRAFRWLPAYDQAHLCAVHRRLLADGAIDPDLLAAALLHDIGKATLGGRVTPLDRTLNVLLDRFAPRHLDRLARLPAPRWRMGLALAVHHPQLGAEWARELGCSERTCWLIAHHANDPAPNDPDLARLIAADRAS